MKANAYDAITEARFFSERAIAYFEEVDAREESLETRKMMCDWMLRLNNLIMEMDDALSHNPA